ncbi:maleylpyruvate isomerase [Spinactinospora alkalitolerans]|uniref:Maleylpyruvate isomerase n=1 Tax=Spinactinospora alkalitolerans TaxID=687207 RepID=A0A852TXF7_9ACTN|nr:maleylpyruvate isomerase N-terminal domain-containing protein [Spinactinospora alkalitolerans]NYE48431.1 maleylpyruvate isomerase [Spinactinospora alkalitolerans]
MSVRDWMDRGTGLFLAAVDGMGDDALDGPTPLPGWTRRHLVAHVHYNAEALRRLVHWAATGQERRMYESADQRAAEIESGARLHPSELRALVHGSARALAADLDALPERAWSHRVVTAQGRTVPAAEIPWMRTREVTVHAVDLDAGVGFGDLPEEVNAALAAEAAGKHAAGGAAAVLAAWLTGRSTEAPDLGPWL